MALLRLPLKDIVSISWQTFLRFPFTLLCAILGTIVTWQQIDASYDSPLRDTYTKLILTSGLGLILFFTLELFIERRGKNPILRYAFMGLGVLLLIGYHFGLPRFLPDKVIIRHFLLLLGLHLTASFAAFLNWREENGFWQFNKSLFLRLLTSALYTSVLYIGISLALLAIKKLFDVKIEWEVFSKLWVFMVGIFNTWFFLTGVPDPNILEQETHYPKGLKLFTQFVLLPLVSLYLFILYGYMAKILFQWSWPRGWVSYLVLGFSTAGIFSLLLIHPIRFSEGNRWIRTYAKWFYRALFPLLVLLLLAIWRRVRDYGITENRYLVLALAFWLLVVAIYFLLSKQKNIKFIPMSLAVAALLSSFGPWGAFSVSERNQTQRLEKLLTSNGLLQEGKIRKAMKPVSAKDEVEISSIMQYLGKMHQYASIQPWFGVALDTLFQEKPKFGDGVPEADDVMKLMGLEYRHSITEEVSKYVYLDMEEVDVSSIKGYDYLVDLSFGRNLGDPERTQEYVLGRDTLKVNLLPQKREIQFIFRKETNHLSLEPLLKEERQESDQKIPAAKAKFILKGSRSQMEVQIQEMQADYQKDSLNVTVLKGRILVKVES